MADLQTDPNTTTVSVNGWEVSSNTETPEQMVEALKPADKEAKAPVVIKPIPPKEVSPALSKAAAKLGAEGGKAAAAARRASRDDQAGDQAKTGDQANSAQSPAMGEDASPAGTGETGLDKRHGSKRAGEATAELARIRRERDQAIARLQQLEAEHRLEPPEGKTISDRSAPGASAAPEQEGPPFKWDDFETPEAYTAAYYQWARAQELEQERGQAELRAIEMQIQSAIERNAEVAAEVFQSEDDYHAKVAEHIRELRPSFALTAGEQIGPEHVIADCLLGKPSLQVYLSDHPDDFEALASLPTPQAIQFQMARIEGRLDGARHEATPSKPATSQAKPPVRPVAGSPQTVSEDLTEIADFDQFMSRKGQRLGR